MKNFSYGLILIALSLTMLFASSCKKKVPTSIDELYTEYVDGEFNGRYTLSVYLCNLKSRYLTDSESNNAFAGDDRFHDIGLTTVANEELPWHFQKLKSGKYIIYSKRKNGQYYLWTFQELDINKTGDNFPKPSHKMLMKRTYNMLPLKPESFFQFDIIKNDFGQLIFRGGNEYVTCYYAYQKKPNIQYNDLCSSLYPATSLGGPILTWLYRGETTDGLSNNWQYAFVTAYDVKKLP